MTTATLDFSVVYEYNTLETGITLPVIIHSGSDTIEVSAKLDTGSSLCIFERQAGELLNLNIESGEAVTVGTATGRFLVYGHEVTLNTLGLQWQATIYFIAEPSIVRNVLGRQGWLDRVRLGLVDYESKLFLSSYHDV